MAIRTLMIRKKLDDANKSMRELQEREEALQEREAELEQAIVEAETEEERSAVEEAVDQFEADKTELDEQKGELQRKIEGLETELAEEEERQKEAAKAKAEEKPVEEKRDAGNEIIVRDAQKGQVGAMANRTALAKMTLQERDAFCKREDMQKFIAQVRDIMQKRDITNQQVLIPTVAMPYLREIAEEASKLMKHTNYVRVPGNARMVIDGGYAEAVWTEMCANLNELTIGFNDIEIEGYKVGGFVKVCNALLEDSDIALSDDILTKIGRGIGYALDKAILYGTGTKMPLGIVPRLAQTAAPADYPATARPWVDLHTTNIISITAAKSKGLDLFAGIVEATGATSNKFATGGRWFAMNEKTYTKLLVASISADMSGAIVAGIGATMPIVGGAIETLDFIPDDVIIGGFDGLYLLAERAGTQLAQSEHRFFIEDQTVFRGTARYDGAPAISEGFIAVGINGASVSATAVTFAEDTANAVSTPTGGGTGGN